MKLNRGNRRGGSLRPCTVVTEYGEHCVTDNRKPGRIAYMTEPKPCRPRIECVAAAGSFKPKAGCRRRRRRK